jgi:protein-L-isoaspartate(D-aspartate) O-methyltransferase
MVAEKYIETPSADPRYIYQNNLVALDSENGINNGEPFLHAAWIGAVSPQPGETVAHLGAGAGYYSAILSVLVLPAGQVHAFELNEDLAAAALTNLLPFENVLVVTGNAVSLPIAPSDIIYVNAAVMTPPVQWLQNLRPGGRLIFPWHPSKAVSMAALVTRSARGFALKPLMPARFISCVGASEEPAGSTPPEPARAWQSRSIRLTTEQAPDQTVTAMYPDFWFSSEPPPADNS